jgi:transposase
MVRGRWKEDRNILRNFFGYSPRAEQAYDFREDLTTIYNMNLSRKQAQSRILHGIQQVQKSDMQCIADFIRLLYKCWQEITNFFIHRENSGFVEGFNNKVKVLKRRCYGIFNLRHLFQCMYLDLSRYRLFAATTIYG